MVKLTQTIFASFVKFDNVINLFLPSATFHIETSHLICSANQMTGFYTKWNNGLTWVKKLLTLVQIALQIFCFLAFRYTLKKKFIFAANPYQMFWGFKEIKGKKSIWGIGLNIASKAHRKWYVQRSIFN